MNRKIMVCLVFFMAIQMMYAQVSELQIIGQPEKLDSEIVAKKDINGNFCAGIKVVSDLDGFKYDSYNGVVDVDDKPGEDLVYVSPGERVMTVYHTGYKPLKIILSEVGIRLRPRETWKIEITGERDLAEIPVAVLTNPAGAEVFVDGESLGLTEQTTLSTGSHQPQLKKAGYEPVIETIMVDADHILFRYDLQKIEDVAVNLHTEPEASQPAMQ